MHRIERFVTFTQICLENSSIRRVVFSRSKLPLFFLLFFSSDWYNKLFYWNFNCQEAYSLTFSTTSTGEFWESKKRGLIELFSELLEKKSDIRWIVGSSFSSFHSFSFFLAFCHCHIYKCEHLCDDLQIYLHLP